MHYCLVARFAQVSGYLVAAHCDYRHYSSPDFRYAEWLSRHHFLLQFPVFVEPGTASGVEFDPVNASLTLVVALFLSQPDPVSLWQLPPSPLSHNLSLESSRPRILSHH